MHSSVFTSVSWISLGCNSILIFDPLIPVWSKYFSSFDAVVQKQQYFVPVSTSCRKGKYSSFTQRLLDLNSTAVIWFSAGGLRTWPHPSGLIAVRLQLQLLGIALLGCIWATDLIMGLLFLLHSSECFSFPSVWEVSFICEIIAGERDVHY